MEKDPVPDPADWQALATALRDLHRALIERARHDYQREQERMVEAGELLQLLTTDPYFEWLRGLSELMVDLDMIRDDEPEPMQEVATAVRPAVEYFLVPPRTQDTAHSFAERYWPYVQDDPRVAMAHAAVKQAIAKWPPAEATDAATLLHERHRVAEKARHRSRLK
jgi:hypothetical protein